MLSRYTQHTFMNRRIEKKKRQTKTAKRAKKGNSSRWKSHEHIFPSYKMFGNTRNGAVPTNAARCLHNIYIVSFFINFVFHSFWFTNSAAFFSPTNNHLPMFKCTESNKYTCSLVWPYFVKCYIWADSVSVSYIYIFKRLGLVRAQQNGSQSIYIV